MPGPTPKPAALRQRRNRSATQAKLPNEAAALENEVPPLYAREGGWHAMVVEWWESVWTSPMAAEYLDADMRGGLYLLAELHQARWEAKSKSALLAVSAEIRQHEVRFGLSPIDRRRLQWEVERAEGAAERTSTRRAKRDTEKPAKDPRSVLKLAK